MRDAKRAAVDNSPPMGSGTTHWERVAETRWGSYVTEIERKVILRGEAMMGKSGYAIDMGCGGGRWSKLLVERGWNLTCGEVDEHSLSLCERKVPSAKCILADPGDEKIPAGTNSAGIVLCIEVPPLIESDWFISEAHRVLTERGLLIGVYINGRSLRGVAWRMKQRLTNGDVSLFYKASYDDWRCRAVSSGFDIVHEESCCWGPFTRGSNSLFIPAFTKLERAVGLHRVVSWSPWVIFIARKRELR